MGARTARLNLFRPRLGDMLLLGAAILVGAPVVAAIASGLFAGGGEAWRHILGTQLWGLTWTTLGVLGLTALFILATAVPAAWLVTMYSFPGRGVMEWLLILPLAAPGYVLAIAYVDLLGVAGPVQSALRDATGLGARDYWFPDITSLGGLAFVLAGALYPYVYLTSRSAFTTTSLCTLDAARTLGASPLNQFRRVAVPGARPAIMAGLALALMEAAADYGAADFLGVHTLTVGLFRAWSSFGDAGAAARMALVLLAMALLLQWLERAERGAAGSQATSKRWQRIERKRLTGPARWGALAFTTGILAWGFLVPIARLIWVALETGDTGAAFSEALANSVTLAGVAAALGFGLGLVIALGTRSHHPLARLARMAASGGYAIPGAVLALGGLVVLQAFGLSLAGPLALITLIWIYVSRFTAAGAAPMEAALARAPTSMSQAARVLGAPPVRRIVRVEMPVALSGALASALILFVEVLKELPATLMLRPFNWETLAVRAYAYASDERLAAAALPCLLITGAGLGPVILLSWRMSRARPGEAA